MEMQNWGSQYDRTFTNTAIVSGMCEQTYNNNYIYHTT